MLLHLRWRAAPRVLLVTPLVLVPALLVWAAALAEPLGLGHPLSALPVPATAATRFERLLLLGIFWAVTLGGPLAAALFGLLAIADAELRIENWEISSRLRLPAPPWGWPQMVAMLLLGLGVLLFLAMAGHLAADCLLGSDC